MKIRNGRIMACSRVGGNGSAKARPIPRTHKAVCGKSYANPNAKDRHNKVYHNKNEE